MPVRTQTLAESAIYPESAAPAVVVSLNDAPIAAQIEALVVDVPVRVGDTVKAGAILVKLACRDFELEQSRLKAERQAIQARLNCATIYWVWGDTGSVTRSVGTVLVQGGGDPERLRAQKDYARARYDYLLNTLRLKQAVGTLSPTDLAHVNQWLEVK